MQFFLEYVCARARVCVICHNILLNNENVCHNILLNNESVCYSLHTNTHRNIMKGTKVINILKYEVSYWNSISNIQIQTELPCHVTQTTYLSITLQGNTDHLLFN